MSVRITLEDRLACQDLTIDFYRRLDAGDFEGLVSLFGPAGVWVRQGVRLVGAGEILSALSVRPAGLRTRHLVSNLLVEPVGRDRARAAFEVAVYAQQDDAPARLVQILSGVDEIVRQSGLWRFDLRQAAPVFRF